jgi:Na+/phosphate symporter
MILKYNNIKTLITLNFGALIVTAFCEVFAIFTYIEKGNAPENPSWKHWLYLIVLCLVSLLFIGSIISMAMFIRMKNKQK